jgi:hypothetical protein
MSYNALERLISMMFPNNLSLLDSTNQPVEYKGNRPAFAVGKISENEGKRVLMNRENKRDIEGFRF